MDKIDVQKSICQNLFGKFRALLGVLRNFFVAIFETPYMQRQYAIFIKSKF